MSYQDDEEEVSGVARFLPAVVVIGALAGFVSLAWYAYHNSGQPTNEDELLIVEADKTPMKEKPLDPGGMKFPNQDKTVFETFAAGSQQPAKVERVLPMPEEPMVQNDTSDTKTWINERYQTEAEKQKEKEAVKEAAPAAKAEEPKPAPTKAFEPPAKAEEPAKPEAVKTEAPVEVKAVEVKTVETPKAESKPEPKTAEKPAAKPAAGKGKIQLGAYKSEAEAKAEWAKIQKKFSQLSGHEPIIVKADLGEKGIFYRLRAGGFADAKATCAALTAKGQACIIPAN